MKQLKNNRQIGLKPNNLCPHCGSKVKSTHYILPDDLVGYWVEHWWSRSVCQNITKSWSGEPVKLDISTN